ncbi:hypothetical protein [Membranihabitans maritimus]|uniref:hypothetical protein n=1 Tax=Membranihabitans maritimus TaxID=2904244 RepID=UPI001F16047B|nr:hypothetical protein [Membranihabitans maritimus]
MFYVCITFILILFNSCTSETRTVNDDYLRVKKISFEIDLDTIMSGHTDSTTWFYPSIGVVMESPKMLVLTIQEMKKGRSDVFTPVVSQYSLDDGFSWSSLQNRNDAFSFRDEKGLTIGMCNFTPKWHLVSKTLLGTCHSVPYRNGALVYEQRTPIWSIYNPKTHEWTKWQFLQLPNDPKYYETNTCADQRIDLPNGDILLPIYYRGKGGKTYTTCVIKCSFDGKDLGYLEHGSELSIDIDRGLFEPSLTRFGDEYYLTIRNDKKGYWAKSEDGLNFSEPQVWRFDNGEEVGTYNTMQHWVTHSEGLFLVYTRKGANNDHVVRHRAPLFIAQVNSQSMNLIRETERILVPNRGASVGNFSVTNINENETWVTVAERMTGKGEELFGASGNVYASKIKWGRSNYVWNR